MSTATTSPVLPFELLAPTEQVPLPMALPPRPPQPGRQRTNHDWLDQQPELYQEVKDRIMGGDTNISRLAKDYAPLRWNSRTQEMGITEDAMRRAIKAMISTDIGVETWTQIFKLNLQILQGEAVAVASELTSNATSVKELGPVAMTLKLAGDSLQNAGGTAPAPVEHKHLHIHTTPEELDRRRRQALERLSSGSHSAKDHSPIGAVGASIPETDSAAPIG